MDPMSPTPMSLDTTSLRDLVALARAQEIHVEDETDRDHVVGLLQASMAADLPSSPPSPPPPSRLPGAAGAAAAPAPPGDVSSLSPPRRFSPMSFGSPPPPAGAGAGSAAAAAAAAAPPRQQLSDILALGGMGRPPGDTSSSVGAEVGTDAGSRGRGSGYGGGGGRGSGYGDDDGDGDDEESDRGVDEDDMEAFSSHSSLSALAVVGSGGGGGGAGATGAAGAAGAGAGASSRLAGMDENEAEERREALEMFMAVTQVGSSATATQFLDATDWSPDAAINLFLESGGDAATATATTAAAGRSSMGGGSSGYGAEARSGGGGALGWPGARGSGYDDGDDEVRGRERRGKERAALISKIKQEIGGTWLFPFESSTRGDSGQAKRSFSGSGCRQRERLKQSSWGRPPAAHDATPPHVTASAALVAAHY